MHYTVIQLYTTSRNTHFLLSVCLAVSGFFGRFRFLFIIKMMIKKNGDRNRCE